MASLDRVGRIDFQCAQSEADPDWATDHLFGPARGKMFGILLCRDREGRSVTLRAFSGQFNGHWQVPGWVAPLFDVQRFKRVNIPAERKIKAMGKVLEGLERGGREWLELRQRRKASSRALMRELFALYRVPNFRGEERPLTEVFYSPGGMPTGSGDCCAPKLLAAAARSDLLPLSLAEFYYGRETASASCRHKQFYSPCAARCQPLLGFMLCGLQS